MAELKVTVNKHHLCATVREIKLALQIMKLRAKPQWQTLQAFGKAREFPHL